jgi:hypothetical protein
MRIVLFFLIFLVIQNGSQARDTTKSAEGKRGVDFNQDRISPAVTGALISAIGIPAIYGISRVVTVPGHSLANFLFGMGEAYYPGTVIASPIGSGLGLWLHNRFQPQQLVPLVAIGGAEMAFYHFLYGKKHLKGSDSDIDRAHYGVLIMAVAIVPLSQILYLELADVTGKRNVTEDGALILFRKDEIAIGLPRVESRYLPVPSKDGMKESALFVQLIKFHL